MTLSNINRDWVWHSEARQLESPTQETPDESVRSCNRHDDCDAADAKARLAGAYSASHCHDECCEDCFGC